MIGGVHHRFGDEARHAHAFERRDPAGTLFRTVHHTGVELNDAVGVRDAPVAHAVLRRIKFEDVETSENGVQDVLAALDPEVSLLHRRSRAAVFEFIPVA